jgi:hypothetical protein
MAPALADDRSARLAFACAVIGRDIESFSQLTSDEAGKLVEEMQWEILNQHRLRRTSGPAPHRPNHLPSFMPHPPAGPEVFPTQTATIRHGPSDRQIWMIKTLAHYMGWDDTRLEAFLKRNFRSRALWALTPRQAWAATRVLLEYAARRDIKLRLGRDHKVSRAEIKAEIPKIKARLRSP